VVGKGHPFRRRLADQPEDRSAVVVGAAGDLELNHLGQDPLELPVRHSAEEMLDRFGLEPDTGLGLIVCTKANMNADGAPTVAERR